MNTEELKQTATTLVTRGKGILAIDESLATIKNRFDSINIESTEENRRAYRDLLITTPGSHEYISGMILFDETIRQHTSDGTPFTEALHKQGIMAGIKVDTGAKFLAGHPGEKITEGLDGLRERLAEYKKLGAKFAKWRTVITIGEDIPSTACISANVHTLTRYAALCQESSIVPIVEPEVLMDGSHDIETCRQITEATLQSLFNEMYQQNVSTETTILKVNMVVSGKDCPKQAGIDDIADMTVNCLLNAVPASLPGIVFLSGGQSAEMATIHLNAMNITYPSLPWPLSFSYGRALQSPCLHAWQGKKENRDKAQAILLHREKCNSMASIGQYTKQGGAA